MAIGWKKALIFTVPFERIGQRRREKRVNKVRRLLQLSTNLAKPRDSFFAASFFSASLLGSSDPGPGNPGTHVRMKKSLGFCQKRRKRTFATAWFRFVLGALLQPTPSCGEHHVTLARRRRQTEALFKERRKRICARKGSRIEREWVF